MKLSELFENAKLNYPSELGDIEITEIVTDSRNAVKGCLFICITGGRYDGHKHIGEAINAGASVIVAEKVRGVGEGGAAAIICVENTRRAASLLYNSWYGGNKWDMKLIGVTGTNGKTSVTNILKRIFEADGKRCGLIGTLGCFVGDKRIDGESNNMTTPDPEQLYKVLSEMRKENTEYVFLEVSSHALALSKTDALSFEVAVFTNLTQDHLDFHGCMESYFEAKARLFTMCQRAVINTDDTYARRLIRKSTCKEIYTVSVNGKADAISEDINYLGALGCEYTYKEKNESFRIKTLLNGSFAVINTLLAVKTARLCGITDRSIKKALSELEGIDGRMERVAPKELSDITVFIDYAHTPDALEKLLKSVRALKKEDERLVLLFGCGGERDKTKRKEMAQIASRLSDFVIITSDNSRGEATGDIIRDILRGIDKEKEYAVIENRRAAIEYAVCNSRPRDIIILAGKGHERYEIDAFGKHPFDEREIVKRSYQRLKNYYE